MDKGRREERVRCMERVTWKLTFPYVKEITNRNLLYASGNSDRGFVSVSRGWGEREMGGRLKREGIHLPMTNSCWGRQKTTKFCKAVILQLKKNKWNFLKEKKSRLKYSIAKMKDILDRMNSTLSDTEVCISDMENRIMEIIQSRQQNEKPLKNESN